MMPLLYALALSVNNNTADAQKLIREGEVQYKIYIKLIKKYLKC
jgi:hypothetical protein